MPHISRRNFLKTCAAGFAAVATNAEVFASPSAAAARATSRKLGQITLGKSGITVSRLAMGTGTNGWNHRSNQTRLGMKGFVGLAEYAHDAGIMFFDAADTYGSHTYLREALKIIPREKVVILTKIWIDSDNWFSSQDAVTTLDRFRKEIGTDYLDIVLLHCQTSPNWLAETQRLREGLSQAKTKGIVRAHGVSCHGFEALKAAAASDWVDILLARINPAGSQMDSTPQNVMPVLKQAHDRGAGVIGMKIFGAGALTRAEQRQQSLEYVWNSGNVDAMTIGFENAVQIEDTITRVNIILR
jgi:aryl-alcohol dehydrogenase-like predicted oxidoreductase